MAVNLNKTTMADAIKTGYDTRLLERALPRLIHSRWARKATISKFGDWEIRKYGSLSAVTSPLGESSTPGEQSAPSISTVTLDPSYYGAWIGYGDEVDLEAFDPILSETSGILGEQAGLSVDTLSRNALISGLTAAYSGGQTAIGNLDSPQHDLDFKDLAKNLGTLEAANARPFDNGRFVILLHPHTYWSLMNDTVFVNLFTEEAGDSSALRSGYMGHLVNCDIYVSSIVYEDADAGVGGTTDVYSAIILGQDAFAVAGMASLMPSEVDMGGDNVRNMTGKPVKPVNMIVKELGSGGTSDPLNQRGSIGWKVSHDLEILDSSRGINLYHTNMYSDD
jgi:N4-gp56 family major capsid protein